VSKAFFLARQTSDLMEDFIRELNTDSRLFLFYGDEGVGKTCTLEELARGRLGDSRIHWIDLRAGGHSDGALVDSSAMIEAVFHKAQAGEIIIADHFEMALKKTRHQLFLNWATDGVDRKLNLIIVGRKDFFSEMCQLSQQYQVAVQSFQQMPLNDDEAAVFLGFYLCLDRPVGNLVLPPLLREQLARAKGNIGSIIEIAERAVDQITSAPLEDTPPREDTPPKDKGNPVLVGVLVALVLVVGVSLYFFSNQLTRLDMQLFDSDSKIGSQAASNQVEWQPDVIIEEAALPAAPIESEAGIAVVVDDVEVAQIEVVNESPEPMDVDLAGIRPAEEEVVPAVSGAEAPTEDRSSEINMPAETDDAVVEIAGSTVEVETGAAPAEELKTIQSRSGSNTHDAETEPASIALVFGEEASAPPATLANRLLRDLQTSLEWAQDSSRQTGTLQIMMLSRELFDELVYYEYIDKFASRGVDIEKIRIFQTVTQGKEVYSVVFGEFESWKKANIARADVPQPLREYSPIPRSVGGLLDEMQRLDAGN